MPIPGLLRGCAFTFAFAHIVGRRRRRRRLGSGKRYEGSSGVVMVITFDEHALGITDHAQGVIAVRDGGDVEPLAIEAFVVDVFPTHRDALEIARELLCAGAGKGGDAVPEAEGLFASGRDDGTTGGEQLVFGGALEVEMAVAGAELEEVRIGIGIANDKVRVAGIDKADVELEEAASAGTGAILDRRARAGGYCVGGQFDAGSEARLVDDEIGGLGKSSRRCDGKGGRRSDKYLIHM